MIKTNNSGAILSSNPILKRLYEERGQSPWLDNLARPMLADGSIAKLISEGVRGITSNPTIFQQSIETTDQYDEQYLKLRHESVSNEDAYWELVKTDVTKALELFKPLYERSNGTDGFVSLEVSPLLAHDTAQTVSDALKLASAIAMPNLMIKVPATPEGIPAIKQLIGLGYNVNVTLIFSLERYAEVIEAYISGLESLEGDLSRVQSVASFFISRVDTAVDPRIEALTDVNAKKLLGKAAVSQAVLAYKLFQETFSGERWEALAKRGAHPQRPLWASTSVKNPAYSNLMYVNQLIAQNTIDTIPGATLNALEQSSDFTETAISEAGYVTASAALAQLNELGINLGEINISLEAEGVAKFKASYEELLSALEGKHSSHTS